MKKTYDFDLFDGIAARDAGIARVSARAEDFLVIMRRVAREIALTKGRVTSDELRIYARDHGIKPHHPNAWGAIFKGPNWIHVGTLQSAKKSNHARWIHIWRYERSGLILPI
jgi:hypothetical protein